MGSRSGSLRQGTARGAQLHVKGGDAALLALLGNILGSQHGGVGRRLIAISLDETQDAEKQIQTKSNSNEHSAHACTVIIQSWSVLAA